MQPPTFNHQFDAVALERIESARMKMSEKISKEKYHQWQKNLDLIESLLPADKQYLVANMRENILQMNDEYDLKIFKQGFADGFLFFKEIMEERN